MLVSASTSRTSTAFERNEFTSSSHMAHVFSSNVNGFAVVFLSALGFMYEIIGPVIISYIAAHVILLAQIGSFSALRL